MPEAEPFYPEGTKVKGSGHFKALKGKVVGTSESGFGYRYAQVKTKDGEVVNARTIYLSPRD